MDRGTPKFFAWGPIKVYVTLGIIAGVLAGAVRWHALNDQIEMNKEPGIYLQLAEDEAEKLYPRSMYESDPQLQPKAPVE